MEMLKIVSLSAGSYAKDGDVLGMVSMALAHCRAVVTVGTASVL